MKKFLSHGMVIVAGVVFIPAFAGNADQSVPPTKKEVKKADPRLETLRRFFRAGHCPIERLSPVFLAASDANHLDWRLLPGISVIESSGGKAFKNNNLFGWNNGDTPFHSLSEGIRTVASRLAHSPYYRNKSTYQKLRTYNANAEYAANVKSVMQQISAR